MSTDLAVIDGICANWLRWQSDITELPEDMRKFLGRLFADLHYVSSIDRVLQRDMLVRKIEESMLIALMLPVRYESDDTTFTISVRRWYKTKRVISPMVDELNGHLAELAVEADRRQAGWHYASAVIEPVTP